MQVSFTEFCMNPEITRMKLVIKGCVWQMSLEEEIQKCGFQFSCQFIGVYCLEFYCRISFSYRRTPTRIWFYNFSLCSLYLVLPASPLPWVPIHHVINYVTQVRREGLLQQTTVYQPIIIQISFGALLCCIRALLEL